MNKAIKIRSSLLIFGIPLLIFATMIGIAKSSFFKASPDQLALGITLDLLLTVPIVYFLLIRKTKIPNTTVVPILILGVLLCSILLPFENQEYLNLFKTWVLPIVELSVFSYIIYNLRKTIKSFKQKKGTSIDFFTTLKLTCSEILPEKLVMPFVTEIAVFYYGFYHWKKRKLKVNEFSYHKKSGTITLLVAFLLIVGIETFVLHGFLAKWSNTAAWILTILSVYSGIQILGFLKSMFKRPIIIEDDKVYLRYGIMNEVTINIKDIATIEHSNTDLELNPETRQLSFLGQLEGHNLIVRLKEEYTLTGLYGVKRNFKNLALHVDEKNEFVRQVNKNQ